MTPRDLLIGVWPWSLPDETASQGADMVLKAFDVAGFVITEKAEIERMQNTNGEIALKMGREIDTLHADNERLTAALQEITRVGSVDRACSIASRALENKP